uniref:Uncharacterized protein n=1 Tax=Strigamia maritima TaxID=126957 RepID=T1JMW5_STRMM
MQNEINVTQLLSCNSPGLLLLLCSVQCLFPTSSHEDDNEQQLYVNKETNPTFPPRFRPSKISSADPSVWSTMDSQIEMLCSRRMGLLMRSSMVESTVNNLGKWRAGKRLKHENVLVPLNSVDVVVYLDVKLDSTLGTSLQSKVMSKKLILKNSLLKNFPHLCFPITQQLFCKSCLFNINILNTLQSVMVDQTTVYRTTVDQIVPTKRQSTRCIWSLCRLDDCRPDAYSPFIPTWVWVWVWVRLGLWNIICWNPDEDQELTKPLILRVVGRLLDNNMRHFNTEYYSCHIQTSGIEPETLVIKIHPPNHQTIRNTLKLCMKGERKKIEERNSLKIEKRKSIENSRNVLRMVWWLGGWILKTRVSGSIPEPIYVGIRTLDRIDQDEQLDF